VSEWRYKQTFLNEWRKEGNKCEWFVQLPHFHYRILRNSLPMFIDGQVYSV